MVRQRAPHVQQTAIEEFGMKAESPKPTPGVAQQKVDRAAESTAGDEPLPKSMVIYLEKHPEVAKMINELSKREDRSKQKIAIRALENGLKAMKAESN